jgi:hypothetical protein
LRNSGYTYNLGNSSSKVTLRAGNVTELTGPITTGNNTVIAAGTTVEIAQGTLTVSNDVTVAGALNVNTGATVTVNSGVTLFLDGSNLSAENPTNGTIAGTITIVSGGKVFSTGKFAFTGSGSTIVQSGGLMYFDTVPTAQNPVPTIGYASNAKLQLTSSEPFIINSSGYILNGNATVRRSFDLKDTNLNIAASRTLTVQIQDGGVGLRVINAGIMGGTSSRIEVEYGSSNPGIVLLLTEGSTTYSTVHNFYSNSYGDLLSVTTDAAGSRVVIDPYTYFTWSSSAGGSGKPGWRQNY